MTTTDTDVEGLVKRLAAAGEGSRELDEDIARLALGWEQRTLGGAGLVWYAPDDPHPKAVAPYFSSSLDAALTLLPEGCWWKLAEVPIFDMHLAAVHPLRAQAEVVKFPPTKRMKSIYAATPALALCIAALRARPSQ